MENWTLHLYFWLTLATPSTNDTQTSPWRKLDHILCYITKHFLLLALDHADCLSSGFFAITCYYRIANICAYTQTPFTWNKCYIYISGRWYNNICATKVKRWNRSQSRLMISDSNRASIFHDLFHLLLLLRYVYITNQMRSFSSDMTRPLLTVCYDSQIFHRRPS